MFWFIPVALVGAGLVKAIFSDDDRSSGSSHTSEREAEERRVRAQARRREAEKARHLFHAWRERQVLEFVAREDLDDTIGRKEIPTDDTELESLLKDEIARRQRHAANANEALEQIGKLRELRRTLNHARRRLNQD